MIFDVKVYFLQNEASIKQDVKNHVSYFFFITYVLLVLAIISHES